MTTIKERAKDLCNDISNILLHHYKGHTTEFAEAKAVEETITLINEIKKETIEKAFEWFSDNITEYVSYNEMDGWSITYKDMYTDFLKAMDE